MYMSRLVLRLRKLSQVISRFAHNAKDAKPVFVIVCAKCFRKSRKIKIRVRSTQRKKRKFCANDRKNILRRFEIAQSEDRSTQNAIFEFVCEVCDRLRSIDAK